MNETEWLACERLDTLIEAASLQPKLRRNRLLAVAFTRRIWHLLADPRSQRSVEVEERHLDGHATAKEMKAARSDAAAAVRSEENRPEAIFAELNFSLEQAGGDLSGVRLINFLTPCDDPGIRALLPPPLLAFASVYAAQAAEAALPPKSSQLDVFYSSHNALCKANEAITLPPDRETLVRNGNALADVESRILCAYVRDVVGNPFRPAAFNRSNASSIILSLARAAYDERQLPSGELDLDRLAVLSDALEEAGAPAEMLEHLRSPGPHVRGCWAVDLCLGLS
jgi:hypothetical protein